MKFIDLFAGLGGFHIGLSRLGHTCVYACEINDYLRDLYIKNFKFNPKRIDRDIREINLDNVPRYDILCAGFPCQPFSKAGTQSGFNHEIAGDMFYYILKFIKAHKPKYLFLENVPNLYRHNNEKTWKLKMKPRLKRLGYDIEEEIISPIHFGIPQTRNRMYILGTNLKKTEEKKDTREVPTGYNIQAFKDAAKG